MADLFFTFVSDQMQNSLLGQVVVGTRKHEVCNVYSPKAFETLIHKNVTHVVFCIVCKIYFLLVISRRSIQSKERVRMCKDYAIGREMTSLLKIAVDSLILEL